MDASAAGNVVVERVEEKDWAKLPKESPTPDQSIAVAAMEDSGNIVGWIFLVAPVHVEGIFISEAHRGGLLMHRLVERAEEEAKKLGLTKLLAYGQNKEMDGYIARLGYEKLPWSIWQKDITTCP